MSDKAAETATEGCPSCGAAIVIDTHAGRLPPPVAWGLWLFPVTLGVGLALADALLTAAMLTAEVLLIVTLLVRARRRVWRCLNDHRLPAYTPSPDAPVEIAVAIPTFNNDTTIAEVAAGCMRVAPGTPLFVIDDGSTDATAAHARAAMAGFDDATLISHPHNRGKGAAIVTALRAAFAAGHTHLVTLDGDGQHDPDDLGVMFAAAREYPDAIVVGARDLSGDNVTGASRFGRNFSNFWLRVLGGARIADSQSGFRVYPIAAVLSLGLRTRRYDFEVEVLTVGARCGLELRDAPIHVYYPPPDERISHFDMLRDNTRISLLNTRLLLATPLRWLGWPFRLTRRPEATE